MPDSNNPFQTPDKDSSALASEQTVNQTADNSLNTALNAENVTDLSAARVTGNQNFNLAEYSLENSFSSNVVSVAKDLPMSELRTYGSGQWDAFDPNAVSAEASSFLKEIVFQQQVIGAYYSKIDSALSERGIEGADRAFAYLDISTPLPGELQDLSRKDAAKALNGVQERLSITEDDKRIGAELQAFLAA